MGQPKSGTCIVSNNESLQSMGARHGVDWCKVYSLEPELAEVFVLQAGPAKSTLHI